MMTRPLFVLGIVDAGDTVRGYVGPEPERRSELGTDSARKWSTVAEAIIAGLALGLGRGAPVVERLRLDEPS